MFIAVPSAVAYSDPWTDTYESRLRRLSRSGRRVAYYYDLPDTSTFRYRAFNPGLSLEACDRGVSASWFCEADFRVSDAFVRCADILVVCRARYNAVVGRLVATARSRGIPVLFDCDDLVFSVERTHLLIDSLGLDQASEAVWDTWTATVGRLEATFRLCDGFVATNRFLLDRAREARPGLPGGVMRNFLNPDQQRLSQDIFDAKAESGFVRDGNIHIGYFSGSPSHARDFAVAAPAVAALMARDPRVRLRVVGYLELDPALLRFGDRVERFHLQDFMNLQRLVGEVEISIAPLSENQFTRSKSELKFFEAAACGTVTVATPTPAFASAIRHGATGFLSGAHAWDDALASAVALVDDAALHRELLHHARSEVLAVYGWERQGRHIVDALEAAAPSPARPLLAAAE